MEHENENQCLDSIRHKLNLRASVILERDREIRELEADKEMLDIRLSELQCAYAEVEQEKEELGTINRDLGTDREADKVVIESLNATIKSQDRAIKKLESKPSKPNARSIYTTKLYWDCECPKNYINHSFITKCEICGAHKADQPDSRLDELGIVRLSGINELAERYARSNE